MHVGVTEGQLCQPQITQVESDMVSDFGNKLNVLSGPQGPCRGRLKCSNSELNSEDHGFAMVSSRSPPLTHHIKLSFLDIPLVFFFLNFYLFLAVLGLRCCEGFSLVVVKGGSSLVAVHWLLIAVVSLIAQHGL